jgi:hypothetical protein
MPAELREACKAYTLDAIRVLQDVMLNGDKDSNRIAAANSLLDRAWGKPAQAITGLDGAPLAVAAVDMGKLSDEELRSIVAIAGKVALPGDGGEGEGGAGEEEPG